MIIGDEELIGRDGKKETLEEGRRRIGLLTMYSPGEFVSATSALLALVT